MKKTNKAPKNDFKKFTVDGLSDTLDEAIKSLDNVIDSSSEQLPEGLDIIVLTPDVTPNGLTSKQGKHLAIGCVANSAILPQEYLEEVKSEARNLRENQEHNQDSQTPQSHPNPRKMYLSRRGRSSS